MRLLTGRLRVLWLMAAEGEDKMQPQPLPNAAFGFVAPEDSIA
jgi:hypothetical protein